MKKVSKKKIISNIIFNIVAIVSTVVTIIFSVYMFKLNMLPTKYLVMFYIIIGSIFLILLILTFPRRIRVKIKSICSIFFIIFSLVFGYGIKYIDKTIGFVDKINDELMQKEEYYVMGLKESKIVEKTSLNGKKIGIYALSTSENAKKAYELLSKEINIDAVEYDDVVTMFEELLKKTLDVVLINTSINSLIDADLSYMKLELNTIHTVLVPIKKVEVVKVVDVTNTPFNIYIAGGDSYGSINKVTNTDVNMVVSVDAKNRKLLLTSIPRDYYVNFPSKGEDAWDKLTHAGYYGIQESILSVEKLLDIDINYYVKVNFSTIEGIIDAIGGVEVNVNKGFTASDGSYTFKKGINHMNGAKALRFARERKVFSSGDVERVKNQQRVLTAIINKITTATTLITNYTRIIDSVSNSFSTNMDTKSINRLVQMQLNDMRGWTIESQNLVGSSAYTKGTYTFPKTNLYVMKQNEESIKKSSTKIKTFFEEQVVE